MNKNQALNTLPNLVEYKIKLSRSQVVYEYSDNGMSRRVVMGTITDSQIEIVEVHTKIQELKTESNKLNFRDKLKLLEALESIQDLIIDTGSLELAKGLLKTTSRMYFPKFR